ncbi:MAG: TRAP transporter small permease [Candidatus Eremiobacteraeota bacterium]|nr:TRAP transporter small permease [Candidatus Eremiobacteraeota bacterium]
MDALYWACAGVASVALVTIALIIPWSVYTRYVVNRAASWPEPVAILLAIVLTFFGAAACYRVGVHMRITVVRDLLPQPWRALTTALSELIVGALSAFMLLWGIGLCATTWNQTIDAVPWLRVGITYLPIPFGAAATVLFVVEKLTIGAPEERRTPVEAFD